MRAWCRAWLAKFQVHPFMLDMLGALSLAFLVWLYARSRDQETIDHVLIPLQVQLAPQQRNQFEVEIHGSRKVPVSFAGPPSRIRELRRRLQRGLVEIALTYEVPEEHANDNQFRDKLKVESTQLPVPPGVLVEMSEESRTVAVTFHRMVERQLPVRLEYTGDVRVSKIKLEPAVVQVRGPKEILDRTEALATLPCALTAPSETAEGTDTTARGQVELVNQVEDRTIKVMPKAVTYRCRVQPRVRVHELIDVPVHFLCPPNYPWRPRFARPDMGKVKLRLVGPATDEPPPVLAFIDLRGGTATKGRNLETVRLQLPRDFQISEEGPPIVAFELEELETRRVTTTAEDNGP